MGKRQEESPEILYRRERVAYWLARGNSQRQVVERLEKDDLLFNPDTQLPWSLGTINSDTKAVKAEWRKTLRESAEIHRARVLAELMEVARTAWVGAVPEKTVQSLLQVATTDSDPKVRAEAVRAIASLGGPSMNTVFGALRQQSDLLGLDAPNKVAPTDPTGTKPYEPNPGTTESDASATKGILALFGRVGARLAGTDAPAQSHLDTTAGTPDGGVPISG